MPTFARIEPSRVVVGVDTHRDAHVAVALDHLGLKLDVLEVPTTTKSYRQLLGWAASFGDVEAWGVEGTGCFGAGLARFLVAKASWSPR